MRQSFVLALLLCNSWAHANAASTPAGYAAVVAGHAWKFPQDYGAHPDFRTEWWYVTGWLHTTKEEDLGFQITFFRTKPHPQDANPSAFTPHEILIAHAAVSDVKHGRLWQDQRIRRAGMGLAQADTGDTRVAIEGWTLLHDREGYHAKIDAADFSMDLSLTESQAPLLNGAQGLSRKGPDPRAASYYYSLPHLKVSGTLSRQSAAAPVSGEAWFDHEWSSDYLNADAVGWDWLGLNLNDGSALMAFRMRGAHGEQVWAGGTYRASDGAQQALAPEQVHFNAMREWVSPRTAVRYPVEWDIQAGAHHLVIRPLLDDQENDTRLSTGAIYWEGAVRAYDAGKEIGRGYLELTGYGEPLKLR
jgi:predicted secreted hydrolase